MVDRLRALLDHPLDQRVARAVVAANAAAVLAFAALVVLGAIAPEPDSGRDGEGQSALTPRSASGGASAASEKAAPAPLRSRTPRQDPQDEPGTAAARRAARALRSHRALQHVPYRDGELAIDLVGARGNRAVLRVRALTIGAARRGWKRFLRRYGDDGTQYTPRFEGTAGRADG